jgi:hypothetical protein
MVAATMTDKEQEELEELDQIAARLPETTRTRAANGPYST